MKYPKSSRSFMSAADLLMHGIEIGNKYQDDHGAFNHEIWSFLRFRVSAAVFRARSRAFGSCLVVKSCKGYSFLEAGRQAFDHVGTSTIGMKVFKTPLEQCTSAFSWLERSW